MEARRRGRKLEVIEGRGKRGGEKGEGERLAMKWVQEVQWMQEMQSLQ